MMSVIKHVHRELHYDKFIKKGKLNKIKEKYKVYTAGYYILKRRRNRSGRNFIQPLD